MSLADKNKFVLLEELFRILFDSYGLSSFSRELITSPDRSLHYSIHTTLPIDYLDVEGIKNIRDLQNYPGFKELFQSITNSFMFKDMQISYKDQIEKLNNELLLAKAKIESLTPFENYFNVQMRLTHGSSR